jgi:hypothetical protein
VCFECVEVCVIRCRRGPRCLIVKLFLHWNFVEEYPSLAFGKTEVSGIRSEDCKSGYGSGTVAYWIGNNDGIIAYVGNSSSIWRVSRKERVSMYILP